MHAKLPLLPRLGCLALLHGFNLCLCPLPLIFPTMMTYWDPRYSPLVGQGLRNALSILGVEDSGLPPVLLTP
jgi:hypothetical protein